MKHISKKEKINFYLGLSGQNMVYSLIGAGFFTYFMTDIAMFPAAVVTVLLIVMKVWDGVNDPIIGSLIDKHTFKNGEKLRPFLRYTPLPVGIFTVLVFLVFSTREDLLWLRVAYFIIMYIGWDITYTLQDVALWGITASVSPNGDERDGFVVLVQPKTKQKSIFESFSLLFKNKMLMLVTLSNLLGALGFGGQLTVYFFKYMIPADFLGSNTFIGALGLTTIYSAITYGPQFIGMIFADKLKKIFRGYRNALIFMQLTNIVLRIVAFAIGFEGINLWIGMILMGIGCIPMGAASIAQTSIFCDSIDYMEWKTGKRMEGVTFSMQTFFTKVSSGITGGLATLALSVLGYVAIDTPDVVYVGTQTAAFETWIWPLFMLTPAIASLLYIIPLLFIKYTPQQRAQVEKELAERRAESNA